jgi:hypothetical protein
MVRTLFAIILYGSGSEVSATPVDADRFFLFIESARIKTAYEFDPHFALASLKFQ